MSDDQNEAATIDDQKEDTPLALPSAAASDVEISSPPPEYLKERFPRIYEARMKLDNLKRGLGGLSDAVSTYSNSQRMNMGQPSISSFSHICAQVQHNLTWRCTSSE